MSLKEYSTLGGTSGKIFLTTIPCFSSSRSCPVNVLVVMPPKSLCSSLKRIVPFDKCHNIFSFHFPLNIFRPVSIGHWLLIACVFCHEYYHPFIPCRTKSACSVGICIMGCPVGILYRKKSVCPTAAYLIRN